MGDAIDRYTQIYNESKKVYQSSIRGQTGSIAAQIWKKDIPVNSIQNISEFRHKPPAKKVYDPSMGNAPGRAIDNIAAAKPRDIDDDDIAYLFGDNKQPE